MKSYIHLDEFVQSANSTLRKRNFHSEGCVLIADMIVHLFWKKMEQANLISKDFPHLLLNGMTIDLLGTWIICVTMLKDFYLMKQE